MCTVFIKNYQTLHVQYYQTLHVQYYQTLHVQYYQTLHVQYYQTLHSLMAGNVVILSVDSFSLRKGILKAGDRILQISGNDMTNASQTEASHLLKSFPMRCSLQIEYDVTCHSEWRVW